MRINCRCSICNKVSNRDIATNNDDLTKKSFVQDPKSPDHLICEDCKSYHEDLMLDYQRADELRYGWLFHPDGENDNEGDE